MCAGILQKVDEVSNGHALNVLSQRTLEHIGQKPQKPAEIFLAHAI